MALPDESPELTFGSYRLQPTQGLSLRSREIPLTPKSLAVLYLLASRAGRVVTKHELHQAVWRNRVVTDAAISSCILELRHALGDDARTPRFIATVHRRGFRFLPTCNARLRSIDVSAIPANETDRKSKRERPGHTYARADAEQQTLPVLAPMAQPSIVVLPFENLTSEARSVVIARGLVHDIITRLARARTMLVIARGTAFQFAGRWRDVQRIGRKLNVRYVVQGAAQLVGSRLKVSVALAEASTRRELWSEQYERKLADFMSLQQDIAESISACLESEVERAEVQRSLLMPSSNLDAWSAYHRGIHYMYRFRQEDCDQAERWFRRSIEMEPGVPRPYAGLSFVHFERAFLNFGGDRAANIGKALEYAMQGLEVDPRDPMAHWALSRANLLRGELQAAKESLETAIELNPSYAVAQYSLGWVGLQLGENELCRDRVSLALRLSPYDPLKFAMLGVYALNLALLGQTAEAVDIAARSTRQANAHHHVLGFAAVTHALHGQSDEARGFLERIRAERPGYGLRDFLLAFPFEREADIRRVSAAFTDLGARTTRIRGGATAPSRSKPRPARKPR